ncbi:MAG TPA: hypothetical protein VGL10_09825 [Gammaproteobacteria bacterium]
MTVLQQIIFDSLVIAFFVSGIAAAIIGVGLVTASTRMFGLFTVMNRYVSTRHAMKPLSVQHDIGPAVQKHRIWFGIVFIIGAAYSIYGLAVNFNADTITAAISGSGVDRSQPLIPVVVETMRWTMLVLSALALVVGVILLLAPTALNAIEAHANRWYSVRKVTVGAETPYLTVDKWVETYPKAAGLAITLGALIVVASSAALLF